jgi:triose/dihydroxyacetone kinase / FAD-AMP lyase (cyclizing)
MRTVKLLNQPEDCVREAVEGILLSTSNIIALENENVLFRSDIHLIKEKEVTLLSGGGSGHEPAHAGYIGDGIRQKLIVFVSFVLGMLSGAILGNVFASPSVSSILAAIRVAAGPHGVLLVVKSYTGDRLNFGIAAQRAKSEGILVEMVLVDDDCALPKGKGITGSRGVAGTILVQKIAGAAARRGFSLANVKKMAEEVISSMGTLGAALALCSVPGSKSGRVLPENSIEMAIGIHGEPGRIIQLSDDLTPLSEKISAQILNQIIESSSTTATPLVAGAEVAILINNLGGISQLELLVFVRDVLREFQSRDIKVTRCYSGSLMTSLEMAGISVTIFQYNSTMLSLLDEATSATAWVPSSILDNQSLKSKRIPHPLPVSPQIEEAQVAGLPCPAHTAEIFSEICDQLILNEPILTQFDQVCGDGDCGLTIKAGSQHLLNKLHAHVGSLTPSLSDASVFLSQLADGVSESMGGTSGILLEIMFRSMALSVKQQQQSPSQISDHAVLWSNALQSGVDSICFYGGATEGMRTLLDSLLPASRKLSQLLLSQSPEERSMAEILQEVALEAEQGMERTKSLSSAAGRSNYISHEVLMGTPDPGAYAVFLVFQAISQFHQKQLLP